MGDALAAEPHGQPLSDVHAALDEIAVLRDGWTINRIANHPDIRPWISGPVVGDVDVSGIIANPDNVPLLGRHGATLFNPIHPGLYDGHIMVLPDGRGAWTKSFLLASIHWMFTRTDAFEIAMRVPVGNFPMRTLVNLVPGAEREGQARYGWVYDHKPVPADLWTVKATDWLRTAPGLQESGRWVIETLQRERLRHGIESSFQAATTLDERVLGAAFEMMMAGHVVKAQVVFNRWAAVSGSGERIEVLAHNPATIAIGGMTIVIREDGFWVASCRS